MLGGIEVEPHVILYHVAVVAVAAVVGEETCVAVDEMNEDKTAKNRMEPVISILLCGGKLIGSSEERPRHDLLYSILSYLAAVCSIVLWTCHMCIFLSFFVVLGF